MVFIPSPTCEEIHLEWSEFSKPVPMDLDSGNLDGFIPFPTCNEILSEWIHRVREKDCNRARIHRA